VQRSKFNVQDPEPSRSFALFRHTAIRREQKFSQLAVPLDHMIRQRRQPEKIVSWLVLHSTVLLLPACRARQHGRAKTAMTNFRSGIDKQHTTPIVEFWHEIKAD